MSRCRLDIPFVHVLEIKTQDDRMRQAVNRSMRIYGRKLHEPRFRRGGEVVSAVAPLELETARVKRLPGKNQVRALRVGETVFHERQITVGVAAVHFIADNGMANVSEVNAKLMFAAGAGPEAHECKGRIGKSFFDGVFSLRGCAVGADTVLNSYGAGFIAAQRSINDSLRRDDVAVDDGEIFFGHGAGFQKLPEFASGNWIFRKENDTGSFAVEAMDEMRRGRFQIKARAADEAGIFVSLGGVANQAGGFVDDEEVGVFVNDGKEVLQK
jgi:hypothetical protein